MSKRHHYMTYGAEVLADGRVRFRLWAPGAEHVELCLEDKDQGAFLSMAAEDAGWFGLVTEMAGAGSLYRYRIDGDLRVPDPASRFQPYDVHGPSQVIDSTVFDWRDDDWTGRPWEQLVFYELNIGAFTPEGTFQATTRKLDYLADLGITAIELMPVADFPGTRDWGYDGVLPFAPDSRYGSPDDLKHLIDSAHAKGIMVFMDVVYNHFGPEGNYLHAYAPSFFTQKHPTPWGEAINFDDTGSGAVRRFFIHNALYWLEEYHVDGLRFDAVHAIVDDSPRDILTEVAEAVHHTPRFDHHIHLVLENDNNAAHYLEQDEQGRPRWYAAQWNDDIHHALHVLTTGESGGYYQDYADAPARHLGRSLTEGFAYQGEPSPYRHGQRRGEPSGRLPPTAFVSFLQNHDQIGNRAFGERINSLAKPESVRAAMAIILLAPSPPLLFMGQEWGAEQPFPFFCDFAPDLAPKVAQGRRREFARFPDFNNAEARQRIPDPTDAATFESAVLRWPGARQQPQWDWLEFHRRLIALRHAEIVPRLGGIQGGGAGYRLFGARALHVHWRLGDDSLLSLLANLSNDPAAGLPALAAEPLFLSDEKLAETLAEGQLPPWSVAWFLATPAP